jgi:hypothetical protein
VYCLGIVKSEDISIIGREYLIYLFICTLSYIINSKMVTNLFILIQKTS